MKVYSVYNKICSWWVFIFETCFFLCKARVDDSNVPIKDYPYFAVSGYRLWPILILLGTESLTTVFRAIQNVKWRVSSSRVLRAYLQNSHDLESRGSKRARSL